MVHRSWPLKSAGPWERLTASKTGTRRNLKGQFHGWRPCLPFVASRKKRDNERLLCCRRILRRNDRITRRGLGDISVHLRVHVAEGPANPSAEQIHKERNLPVFRPVADR